MAGSNPGRFVIRIVAAATLLGSVASAQLAEQGLASWYGGTFDGRVAASGEIYHQDDLTAAHRTLPFGTNVRIRRTDTGEAVIVRINDRGPYIESRIIDLSNAAARRLNMVQPGVVPVALEILGPIPVQPSADSRATFVVQAGTFRIRANAERTRALLAGQYGSARITPRPGAEMWNVFVGSASTREEAEALAVQVRKAAKGLESAFVVRVEPGTVDAE